MEEKRRKKEIWKNARNARSGNISKGNKEARFFCVPRVLHGVRVMAMGIYDFAQHLVSFC